MSLWSTTDWSWFAEEPLDKMAPPDWNWADFCGAQLLQVAIDHMDRVDTDLQQKVRESIIHAGRAIKKRNVGPGYTNIAVMGAYVTLVAGGHFDDQELAEYGRARATQRVRRSRSVTIPSRRSSSTTKAEETRHSAITWATCCTVSFGRT